MSRINTAYRNLYILLACLAVLAISLACGLPGALGGEVEPSAAPKAGKPPARAKLGDTWTSEADGMTLVYVPGGKFLMGALEYDENSNLDEIPLREVELASFWIDQTEVTNAMFAAFLNKQGNQKQGNVLWYEVDSPDALISVEGIEWAPEEGYEDHPVYEVTWHGAQAYCQWVGRRLPTEAEWEKAARGNEGLIYPWGDTKPNCGLVNFWDGSKTCADGTAPVGRYPAGASPYGALDMAGNVWEWVADWYTESYYEEGPIQDPTGPAHGSTKVFRGGAWESGPRNLRASDRNSDAPNAARYRLGFRCALTP